jgi:hypothetical protein
MKPISQAMLLGRDAPLQFTRDETALTIALPLDKPNDYAYAFRIS